MCFPIAKHRLQHTFGILGIHLPMCYPIAKHRVQHTFGIPWHPSANVLPYRNTQGATYFRHSLSFACLALRIAAHAFPIACEDAWSLPRLLIARLVSSVCLLLLMWLM